MGDTVKPSPEAVAAGHAFYTRRTLAFYDLMILGYFSRVAWRCPAGRLVDHHDRHITANHLDVGVGTGYFLDRSRFPSPDPRVVLMDPNQACLDAAGRRLARYEPERIRASVLDPVDYDGGPFDSVSMTYLLHCLPGTIDQKAIAVEHVVQLTAPGAVVFGATLLSGGVDRTWYARAVMRWNNQRGIFANANDDVEGLHRALEEHLDDVTIEIIGCAALFAGRIAA